MDSYSIALTARPRLQFHQCVVDKKKLYVEINFVSRQKMKFGTLQKMNMRIMTSLDF